MNQDHFAALDTDPLAETLAAPRREHIVTREPQSFTEPCPKCRGRGRFITWSGRDGGACFTCQGTGTRTFRQSAERRATQRQARQTRQQANRDQDIADFCQRNPEVWAWLQAKVEDENSFAQSLMDGLERYGSLTDNQIAAVRRSIQADADREAARASVRASEPARTSAIDASKIQQAFDRALEYGRNLGQRARSRMAAPRIQIGGIKFKLAGQQSRNPGAIYVLDTQNLGPDGKPSYLGKIQSGQFTCTPVCPPERVAEVTRIAEDPEQAAIAHGRITGNCAICSRELTRHDSITRGIGPICASRMGW